MSEIEKLPLLLENLDLLKEDSKQALDLFNSIISQIESSEETSIDVCQCAKDVAAFLGCGISEIELKAAETLAELCKTETPRAVLSTDEVIGPLIKMLSDSTEAKNQACRALGNICFDNNNGRNCFFEKNGLAELVEVLKSSSYPGCEQLRTNAAGCLLNVIMAQDPLYPKVVELGVMEVLCDLLMFGVGSKQAEETAIHIYVILGLLTDSGPGNICLSQKLCEVTVNVLAESTNGELSELCVELLHSQAENEDVKLHLAKAGLCELLIDLLEKYGRLADDDETRNLLKMACDLIIIILSGDASMEVIYGSGRSKVFEGLLKWLDSSDDDLQVTAALCMANFARTDKHCIQMVHQGVSEKLLKLLEHNNTSDAKIRLQHALLSALRNLVIPAENKSVVLKQGLVQAVDPMFNVQTFPVVFKLLGTLRMIIDGQPEAANELGTKESVIQKLVEWSGVEDHPGVQGEANRLLAWIIKNSRDRDVIGRLVGCGAVPCLVGLCRAEHSVMQTEALLALTLVAAMRGQDAAAPLYKAGVGPALVGLLSSTVAPPREVFQNLTAFVGHIVDSGEMRRHLRDAGLPKALYSCVLSDSLADLRDQVSRLTTLIEAG